eukprot:CAMPEP_0184689674 /NCGR_PEP_ID=MMETSP0312-20130426/30789_1 /TAXON_ID=31354 /ORGANISM="Compsopogon coeruleus, Strain SAG 36.94" /LENGTH=449 /DNA_ID=CAMNT_0027147053 /DNA_START=647 /DNA_END=1996 /DNA_ORIENTATION=-
MMVSSMRVTALPKSSILGFGYLGLTPTRPVTSSARPGSGNCCARQRAPGFYRVRLLRVEGETSDAIPDENGSGQEVGEGGQNVSDVGTESTPLEFPPLSNFFESLRLRGEWTEIGGNFVLRPARPTDSPTSGYLPAKGVIHFIGGAFVGAAPHLAYRYLLEKFAEKGYVVVTTPYRLKFDYVELVGRILDQFDQAAVSLALDYGPIPIVGVGHSLGALLHALSCSLFKTEQAATVLMSYNNKPVTEAIPLFREAFAPFISNTAAFGTRNPEVKPLFEAIRNWPGTVASVLEYASTINYVPKVVSQEFVPIAKEGLEVFQQFPSLFDDIAAGVAEFDPTPDETKTILQTDYASPNTLLLCFSDDQLDQTPVVEEYLKTRGSGLDTRNLTGTHLTPLMVDPFAVRSPWDFCLEPLNPILKQPLRAGILSDVDRSVDAIDQWLQTLIDADKL